MIYVINNKKNIREEVTEDDKEVFKAAAEMLLAAESLDKARTTDQPSVHFLHFFHSFTRACKAFTRPCFILLLDHYYSCDGATTTFNVTHPFG